MSSSNRIFPYRRARQKGAALVVGLLLLLVLTLLAISGMNTASLELVMAGNTQFYQNAFQAAETGIEQAIQTADFNPGTSIEGPTTEDIDGTSNDAYTISVERQLNGAAQPAIWGSTWDSFSTYHFEIDSAGASARNARANNIQGVAVISPADSTVAPLAGVTGLSAPATPSP
jgi:type IV pilus assembly protein PilX